MTKVYAVVQGYPDAFYDGEDFNYLHVIAIYSTEEKATTHRDTLQAESDARQAADKAWQEKYNVVFHNACAEENIVFHDRKPMTPERRSSLDRAYAKTDERIEPRPMYDGYAGGSGDYRVQSFEIDA